jgi:hypothetical protein
MGPLDALVTYKYNDLENGTFDVIYINLKMKPMRAIIDGNGNEIEDKEIPVDDLATKY